MSKYLHNPPLLRCYAIRKRNKWEWTFDPKITGFFYYLSVSIPGSDRRLSKFLRRYTVLIVFKIKKLNLIKYCDCREGVCTS